MVQANPVELLFEEVYLDFVSSRCFHARRRQIGGISFDKGAKDVDRNAFAPEVEHTVKVWKEGSQKGAKPVVVLHGYADRDEANGADAAKLLSEQRAQSAQAWLVERGIPENQIRIEAHGWDLSARPVVATDMLPPHRRVEISHDTVPTSEARRSESGPIASDVLRELQEKARALANNSMAATDPRLAPHVVVSLRDNNGTVEAVLSIASSDEDAIKLHRYFLAGLSGDCTFGPLP